MDRRAGGGGLFGAALVLVVGQPAIGSDQGVFLSVAARLLDGDALYAEVVDNKDPLFFVSYAGALWVGGWRGPSLLDGLWFGLAAIGFAAMLRALGAPRAAVAAGFFVYPLALAGGWYFTGLSMLGALSFAPCSAWLWLRQRFAAAGALAALGMLFKLNLALLFVTMLAALLVLDHGQVSRLRQAATTAAGAVATFVVAAAALAAQGSLHAYVETIAYNAHYANARIESDSHVTRTRAHLAVLRQFVTDAGMWRMAVASGALVAFAVVLVVAFRRDDRGLRTLVGLAAATLVSSLISIGLTAYYSHHLQLLAFPLALMVAAIIAAASTWLGARVGLAAAVGCVALATWAAVQSDWPPGVSQWSREPVSAGAHALEQARVRHFPGRDVVEYVVFGSNGEDGHAAFIDDSFDLACRWFHLYRVSTDEQFAETVECFERARPPLVLVSFGFTGADPEAEAWNAFVADVRRRLERHYMLLSETDSGFQVWRIDSAAER